MPEHMTHLRDAFWYPFRAPPRIMLAYGQVVAAVRLATLSSTAEAGSRTSPWHGLLWAVHAAPSSRSNRDSVVLSLNGVKSGSRKEFTVLVPGDPPI